MANKLRFKGWWASLERLQTELDLLIVGTPTSELRNKLTDLNIKLQELREFNKVQDEVL